MLSIAINGLYLSKRTQGIVRYARELVTALDRILEPNDDVLIIAPRDVRDVPDYINIKVLRVGHLRGKAWEQVDLAAWSLAHKKYTLLNLCNVAPIAARPGITTVHDVMYRACPEFYVTLRNRVSRLWHCVQYALLVRREIAILTVSEFSRHEIERLYPSACGKVRVVPNAWQHVESICAAEDWQSRYPSLVPGEYMFTMATLARNKNIRWIYEVARRNPKLVFVVAGKRYESDDVDKPSNVRLLGFVHDEDACALIKHCRAFLFPSLYEGFGLPPLEALACGAVVVSSNTASLPEVLGSSVLYVDPYNYEVDLEELLGRSVSPAEESLARYSWLDSAKRLFEFLVEVRRQ